MPGQHPRLEERQPTGRHLTPRYGCATSSRFRCCHAPTTAFRVASSIDTAPPSRVSNPLGFTCWRFTSASANRSASSGRNSSIRSSASPGRPGRSVCRNPTDGSSPAAEHAATQSWVSRAYRKESRAFIRSSGGRRVRPAGVNSARFGRTIAPNTPKYARAASPSRPRTESTSASVSSGGRSFPNSAAATPSTSRSAGSAASRPARRSRLRAFWIFQATAHRATAARAAGSSALRNCSRRRSTFPDPGASTRATSRPASVRNLTATPASAHNPIAGRAEASRVFCRRAASNATSCRRRVLTKYRAPAGTGTPSTSSRPIA
ncbi:MAG TPA: hypothetical protein VD866_32525 [Urbifossiella sp.]|nr:hypothetical protein [Urbifossiella sp.]